MPLLRSLKNDLFDLLTESGFSPNIFSYTDHTIQATLEYTLEENFDFYFGIDIRKDGLYDITFSPGHQMLHYGAQKLSWFQVKEGFINWLKHLRTEINSVDKWERLNILTENIDIKDLYTNQDNYNIKFNKEEQREIKSRITMLQQQIESMSIGIEQVEIINKKLDHLVELTDQLSKFDWTSQFVGAIIGLIIQIGLPQEDVHTLLMYIKQFFNGIIFLN